MDIPGLQDGKKTGFESFLKINYVGQSPYSFSKFVKINYHLKLKYSGNENETQNNHRTIQN